MAWYSKCTLITHFFMVSWFYVQGANNGFMVSTYSPYDGRIKAYQGDVESMINMATVPSKQVSLRYSYITSLAADPQNGSLYLLDVQFKSIYRLDHVNVWFNNSKMAFTRLHEGISIAIGSIVFDWISRNIYWTDRYHNWISMMPVSTNDSLMFRAVVEEGVSVPVALAIDPKAGLLFWSDTQPSARIEWSNLLGENRTVMLSGNMKFIIALAVDPEGQMLYFTDYLRQTLEAVQYGGYNRTVLVRLNTYELVDMAFYKDYLCVVDQRYRRTLCYSTTGKKVLSDTLYSNPWGICVFDKSTQSTNVTDYCSEMNCTHFCVNMPTEARCVCKEGFDLQDDNITCIAKHGISGKGLVFTNGTGMCILHITSITGAKIQPECIEANLGNGTSYLQADSNEGKIHFWNATGKMLQTYDLLSNTTRLITHTGNNVTGLFYDWIADDLYWSESDTGLIKVAALKEATVEVTNIFTQLSNPKSLTGNPHKYELYWISGNSSSGSMAILRGSFNGTDVKQVINSSNGIGSPIALVFDEVRHRLYWLDNDRVRSVNTNGTDAEQHIRLTGANTFLIYKDYFIWRVGRNEIRAAFLDSSNAPVRIDLTVHGNVTGLCVFDSRIQRKERGPCEEDNGQCEHICLPSESGPVCRCKIGYRIAPDGKSCKSGTVCDTSAIKIQNGRVKDGCTGAIGEMCDYECDKDFTKTSLLKRFTCTKNGIWDTDFMGFCRKIECDRDMLFQPGRLSVECEVFGGKICNYTCNEGYENSRISCFSNGTWNNSLSAMCKEIYEKNAPNSPQASKAGLIGATIGGIIVVILVAVIIITVICFIRIRRRKLSEQGVYKNNPNVPFPNQNLRNNPYEVFDNPPEPDRSNDGSIQFANPLTGIEQPPNNIYSESSNQPNLSIEGATGRGVQFSNPLCFVDDVYVSVSD